MQKELERYLHEQIPISGAMGVCVKHATVEEVVLTAPLANNINHQKTVFGGSLHAVAALACWSLLYIHLQDRQCGGYQIVITKSEVKYQKPVEGDFIVNCKSPEDEAWGRFDAALQAKGRARIDLSATIMWKEETAVLFEGIFAALRGR